MSGRSFWRPVTRPIFLVAFVLAVALLIPALHPWAWVFGLGFVALAAVAAVVVVRDRRRTADGPARPGS